MNKSENAVAKAIDAGDFSPRQRAVLHQLLEQGAAQYDLYLIISRLATQVGDSPENTRAVLMALTKRNVLIATPRRGGIRPYSHRIAPSDQWKIRGFRGSIPPSVPEGVFAIRA